MNELTSEKTGRLAIKGILLIAATFLVAGSSFGQTSRSIVEVGGGMDLRFAPEQFTELWGTGGGADFKYSRYLGESLALTLGASFNRFTINREKVEAYLSNELPDSLQFLIDFLDVEDGDVTIAAARVGVSYDFQLKDSSFEDTNEGKIFFYVRGATGVSYNQITDLELALLGESASVEGAGNVGFTVEGGGGMRFYLTNGLGLSVESVLAASFVEGETLVYLPIRMGVFVGF